MIVTPRLALLACLLLIGTPAIAQAQAAPETDVPVAKSPGDGSAAVPAAQGAAPADAPAASPAALEDAPAASPTAPGAANDARQRRLSAGGTEFGVHVLPITGGPAQGAMVLVPGDGRYPATSLAIDELRTGMPAFGWTTWLPELESPPRSHSGGLQPGADAGGDNRAQGAAPQEQEQKASDAGAGGPDRAQGATPQQGALAQEGEKAAGGEQAGVPLEAERARELQEWATRTRARLAAAVTAAAGEGRVVVVAEGVAAGVLTGFAAELPNAAFALVLVNPVELPGLPANWPRGSATPVMEVFDPAEQRRLGAQRRASANAAGLHYYRQTVLTLDAGTAPGEETLLVRRLRGWLRSLESQDAR